MSLTDRQLERYARHIILRGLGGEGQNRLLAAKILLVGAGGLGSPILLYLAAAGLGSITLVDDDAVALSNLQRQVLFREADIGEPKVERAKIAIAALNGDVAIDAQKRRIDAGNAGALIQGHDLVIDGCDNFTTRFIVADACLAAGIPLLSAAVGPYDGQLALFEGHLADKPCYRCFVPSPPPLDAGTCSDDGVVGALCGIVGAMAALEAVKYISGLGETLSGQLLIFDALSTRSRTIALGKDPDCRVCGARSR